MTYPSNEVDGGQLQSIVSRIEKLEDEKSEISETIRDVYAESKSSGFDPKILRKIVSLRKKAAQARREEAELLRVYASALQMDLFA